MAVTTAVAAAEALVAVGTAAYQLYEAGQNKNKTEEDVGNFNDTTPVKVTGGTTTNTKPATATTFGSKPITGLTSDPSTPSVHGQTEADIAKERYAEAETEIETVKGQIGQTILGEKASEIQAEGGIRASAAARGLKLEGSPLMQLIAQEDAGKKAVTYTQTQGIGIITGMQQGAQASYDAAALAGKEQLDYADQELSSAWLGAFTSLLSSAASMVDKFWNPNSSSATNPERMLLGDK